MTLTTGRDINGNSLLRIKIGSNKAFSMQVNGEGIYYQYKKLMNNETLTPEDHQNVINYINRYGTARQKELIRKEELSK